jgi:formylglycine-generating enzyme required for sulfatase activity
MNVKLFDAIKNIVERYGENIFNEPQRFSALLSDLAYETPKAQRNVFVKCLEYGFFQTLKNTGEDNRDQQKQRLAQRLHKQEGFMPDLCTASVDLLAALLFGETLNTPPPVLITPPQPIPHPSPSSNPADMAYIQGGTFMMGSPADEPRREDFEIQHSVTVSSFYMDKYQVTQKQYEDITGKNPSKFKGHDLPAENISWYEAVQYCNNLSVKEGLTPAYTINGEDVTWNRNADGYRLPTEAEWEYACRAGTTTPVNTGNSITTSQANYD